MGIFHKSKPAREFTAEEIEASHQQIEALARAAEPDALRESERLAQLEFARHTKDRELYAFECRRWGQFLQIAIKRKANDFSSSWSDKTIGTEYATAINLNLVEAIRFQKGRGPDRDGTISYLFNIARADDSVTSMWPARGEPLSDGDKYKVFPQLPYVTNYRPLFVVPQKGDREWGRESNESYEIKHKTVGSLRCAADDRIIFQPSGMTIHAPAGLGADIYQKILEAKDV